MVLKVLGIVGLNFVISLFIVAILFVTILIKIGLTKKSHRIVLTLFALFCEFFITALCFKWFSIWALLLPSLMLLLAFFCLVFYKDDDNYEHKDDEKAKSYYDSYN